jgi:hypothetical protein
VRHSRSVVLAAAFVVSLLLPAGAGAAVLYDQTTGTPGSAVQSAHHAGTPDPGDSDAADDFTVPPRVLFRITSVDVVGQELAPEPATVLLFADAGTRPGDLLFRQGGIPFPPGSAGNLLVTGTPPLPPGRYWLSVYTTYSAGAFDWRAQDPVSGMPAVWENPENGSLTGCAAFTALAQCGHTNGNDLMFRINGDVLPVTHKRKCKRKRHRATGSVAKKRKKRCRKRRR